jgi:DNA-binding Lrp family transcriptional regulator
LAGFPIHAWREIIMTSAYVLIKVGPEASFELLPAIREIKGVQQAHAIMGPIDGVAFVEVADLEELSECVMAIREVKGVESTDTRLAWPF